MSQSFFTGVLLPFLLLLNAVVYAQDFAWVKPFGDPSCSISAKASCTDPQGNIYTQGTFTGTVDFDPGPGNYTLNAISWQIYVTKLDSSGNFVWVKSLPALGNESADIAADKQGNVYLFNHFGGTLDMDPGPGTYTLSSASFASYILKLDSGGNFVWARKFTGGLACWGESIAVDGDKNIYTTGAIYGDNIDFDPDTSTYFLSCDYSNGPGGTGNMPNYTFFICKLDSMGKFVYARKPGGAYGMVTTNSANQAITISQIKGAHSDPGSLLITQHGAWARYINGNINVYTHTVDKNDNVYVVGVFSGTLNVDPNGQYNLSSTAPAPLFILKLNSAGNFVWARQLDLNTAYNSVLIDETLRNLTTDVNGNVYLSGTFTGPAYFNPNGPGAYLNAPIRSGFILSLDSSGNYNWVKQVGQNSNSGINCITSDRFGNLYTTGSFSGSVDFDPGWGVYNLSASNDKDVFVHKLGRQHLVIGINETTAGNDFRLFPNPANSRVYLQSTTTASFTCCRLLNTNGQLMQEFYPGDNNEVVMDVSQQATGFYILEVVHNNQVRHVKLIKD